MAKPNATIYDIAALVGVNASTVSRALSRPGRVSAETQRRIEEAARALDYRVNTAARAVKTGRHRTLGLVIPDASTSVYYEVLRGVRRAAEARGYLVLLGETVGAPHTWDEFVRRLRPAVDGVLLVSTRQPEEGLRELAAAQPLVVVNRVVDGVPSVAPDLAPGTRALVQRAAALGHRRLAYLAGSDESWMSVQRGRLLAEACADAGLEAVTLGSGSVIEEHGAAIADDVLASGCTVAVAFNDRVAIGLLKELADRGVPVPGRVSVVGFDDIRAASYTTPPLATVASPLGEVGELAARVLLAAVEGDAELERPSLPAVFVERASLGPVRAS